MPKEILEIIAKLLQQGKSEQEIIQTLIQNEIPEAQAVQAVEMVKRGMQSPGNAGKPQGGGSGSKGLNMLRSLIQHVGPETVFQIIGAVLDLKGNELNGLISELKESIANGKGQMQEAENGYPQEAQQPSGNPAENPNAGLEI